MSAANFVSIHPGHSAELLRQALAAKGVAADVHDGYGLALVSVWVGLVVWCDGNHFWWRTGWNAGRRRVIYAWHPAIDPVRAAHRVAMRYADLRSTHSATGPLAELLRETEHER
ncbi:hypothetical protein MTP10_03560 [Nonomuraea sp. 3-1Str]|uniref:hypothetical protein n=1 Tax=Nonomuraea sp. 3-1Str TaxID=2929801 RepID=UPI002856C722|nr:hypothetical protein [Nonomuraea sp. 3-1Str]MDR8407812.1 hypothetical protein [Nonomuraea sp. 3-1Str]